MNKKTYSVTIIFMAIILVAVCAVCLIRVKGLESQLDSTAVLAVERDEMAAKLAESESYVGAIRTERDAVNNILTGIQSERDAANESLEAVQAERDAANAIAEAVKTERDILYKRLDEAYARIIELEAQLGMEPTVTALPEEIALIEEPTAEPTAEATEEPTAEATEESAPEATEVPEVTEVPETTEVPEATEIPEATEEAAPEVTEEPAAETDGEEAADDAEGEADAEPTEVPEEESKPKPGH